MPRVLSLIVVLALVSPARTDAQQSADELAKQLANPVSSLISVPFQNNLDWGVGPSEKAKYTLNIQPVVPLGITEHWNLIVRTILPVVGQPSLSPDGEGAFGLGDAIVTGFLSPKVSDPIWGVGPAVLVPTSTDDQLGLGEFGIGPSAVVLKQTGPWTYGALVNQIWTTGDAAVSSMFLQPFLVRGFPGGWTVVLNSESTRNWTAETWTIPFNLMVNKVSTLGDQLVSYQVGLRVYAESPNHQPQAGLRAAVTLLFPK